MDVRISVDSEAEILRMDEVFQFIKLEDGGDGPELALVGQMVKSVCAHFEKRTGLSFTPRTYEVYFSKFEKPFILPISPVISIDKVEEVDLQGNKTALIFNTHYYKKGLYTVEIQAPGYDDLLVTFQAGYGHEDTQELPFDIKQAIMMQVLRWYDNRDDFYELKFMGSIERILQLHKTRLL